MQSAGVVIAPVEQRRRKGGLAVILIAVAAIGGGIAWLALRKTSDEKHAKHEDHAQHPRLAETAEPVERAKPAPVAAVEEPAQIATPNPVVKQPDPKTTATKQVIKADPTKVDAKRPVPAPIVEDDSGDETIKSRIREAEAAYHAGDFSKAEHLANFIITHSEEGVGENQMAHAFALHGLVACSSLHNSQSDANGDLRHLTRYPKLRARLIKGCKDSNIELSTD